MFAASKGPKPQHRLELQQANMANRFVTKSVASNENYIFEEVVRGDEVLAIFRYDAQHMRSTKCGR